MQILNDPCHSVRNNDYRLSYSFIAETSLPPDNGQHLWPYLEIIDTRSIVSLCVAIAGAIFISVLSGIFGRNKSFVVYHLLLYL